MCDLGTREQDDKCQRRADKGEEKMKTAFDKLSDEFGVVAKITTQIKSVEQFRQEIIADIFQAVKEDTDNSVSFVEKADYIRAKFCECKIEGLHKALSIILDASTINVKDKYHG